MIVSVIFLTLALDMRPWPQSVRRAFLWSNVYLLCAGLVDYLFDANYGYLREKPQRASLLDYLGPVADLYRWTRDCRGIRVFRSLLAVLNCGQSSQARLTMALPRAHFDVGHQFSRQDLTSPHSSTRGPFRP